MASEPHDRNVYILGAGFSAPAGAPLVRDFLDRSREFLEDPTASLDEVEREQFRNVFEFRQTLAQAREKVTLDLDDIEQLFGLVEMFGRLGLGGTRWRTRSSTVYLIAKTLELSTRWSKSERPRIRLHAKTATMSCLSGLRDVFTPSGEYFFADMYDYFASLLSGLLDDPERRRGRMDSVITFNYDLVLDDALRRIGFTPEYHLPKDLFSMPDSAANRRPVCVLKLHGSTNWAVCTKCHRSIFVLDEKVTRDPSSLRDRGCSKCHRRGYQPLLIPPSWDKREYREITQTVWNKAVHELATATRICIIGYSMPETDAFFRYLLALALAENHGLFRLTVVDLAQAAAVSIGGDSRKASGKPLEQKYRELLDPVFQERRFSFHPEGVVDFLASSANVNLGRGDGLASASILAPQ